MNFKAERNLNVENAILLAFAQQELHSVYIHSVYTNSMWASQLPVCVRYMCELTCSGVDVWCQDNHMESVRCHACHAYEANRQRDSYTVSADRRTDLGTAVYAYICEYSICSTVKYMREYLYPIAFVKGVWEMETTETAVSWAGHKYKEPECERWSNVLLQIYLNLPGLHPSNQEPSEPHIRLTFTYSAQD